MARLRIDGLDQTIRELQRIGRFEEIATKAVDAAAPILEASVKSGVRSAAAKGYATGELEKSIKKTKAKMNQWGAFSVVAPTGRDQKGNKNADKLLSLEYGNSHQDPHPFLEKAKNNAEEKCIEAMEETVCQEVGAT